MVVLFIGLGMQKVQAQAAQEIFGKNRIQYRTFKWKYLSSTNFDVYYYNDSINMARTAARYAEAEFARISDLMGFSPYNKIRIYLYNSRAHLLQSNVGLEDDNNTVGGRTNFAKNLVEIAYPGSQVQYREKIAEGIASKLAYDMMYGGSLKESVQNSYLLILPDWFMGGIVKYASQGWSRSMDNEMRHMMEQGVTRQPANYLGEKAALVGQSIWAYIAMRYGNGAISNVLNQTRLQRDEEESIMVSLGVPYGKFIRDWRSWYITQTDHLLQYAISPKEVTDIARLNADELPYQLKTTADGRYTAWTENENGAWVVKVWDRQTGKRSTPLRGGYSVLNQPADMQVPVLAWHGTDMLHMMVHRYGRLYWVTRNMTTGKTSREEMPQLQQVNSLDVKVVKGSTYLLMSLDHDNRTDLAVWQVGRYQPTYLTNDLYDDNNPVWLGDTAIAFSSNRPTDTLRIGAGTPEQMVNSHDLWLYRLPAAKPVGSPLKRLTQTWYNEVQPMPTSTGLYYLQDQSGVLRLSSISQDAAGAYVHATLTDYAYDLEAADVASADQPWLGIMMHDGRRTVVEHPAPKNLTAAGIWQSDRMQQLRPGLVLASRSIVGDVDLDDVLPTAKAPRTNSPTTSTPSIVQGVMPPTAKRIKPLRSDTLGPDDIDIRNYVFELEKLEKPQPSEIKSKEPKEPKLAKSKTSTLDDVLRSNKQQQLEDKALAFGPFEYRNRMNITSVYTSLEINPLAGWGVHLQSNLSDLFENHKIYAGGTLFGNLTSHFIFGEYQYLRHLIDLKLRYDRQLLANDAQTFEHRYTLDKVSVTASYPLTIKSSVSLSPFVAQTHFNQLLGATSTLLPDVRVPYAGLRAEFIFDNTQSRGLNMQVGSRVKAGVEYWNGAEQQSRSFGSITVDARHYQPIFNEIVLALRTSYGNNFGPAAKQFLLGGMDNWINNLSQRTGILDETSGGLEGKTDWLFTRYATNMRGFNYNAMSGTSYLLFNAELRMPIVRAFYRGPISSNFFRNLQLTAFTDAGSAWTGGNPFTTNNSINTRRVQQGALDITVINYKNPFLISYGIGARTLALGYYLKLDVAQGIQDGVRQSPSFLVTLGNDF